MAVLVTDKGSADQSDVLVLSERNTVSLQLPVSNESVTDLQREFIAKSDKLPPSTPMYLVLNSPGGSVDAGLQLVETLKGLPNPIHTIQMFSASMSFMISQLLGTRYVMQNSTLMAHPAYIGGVEGQVPGSFITRANAISDDIAALSSVVAKRAGLSLPQYVALTQNELWLSGPKAVETHFADKVVTVRCDKTLRGLGPTKVIDLFIFRIRLRYDKCPLITMPDVEFADARGRDFLQATKRDQVKMLHTAP